MRDGAEAAREFVERYGWRFPVIDDDWSRAGSLGIAGHPAVVLVDAEGRVAGGFYGAGDAASWDALAAQL